MANKIEKELTGVLKVKREDGEMDQDYFLRLVKAGKALFSSEEKKSEDDLSKSWEKLSNETQEWFNTADEAADAKETIPDFDGVVAEEEEQSSASEEAEEEQGEVEETVSKKEKKVAKKKAAQPAAKEKAAKGGKKAAPEKEAKSAKKSNGAAKRGRKGSFGEDDKIKTVAKENPFREGSKAAKCFDEYKVGKTVAAVLAAGVPRSKFNRHMKKGYVTVAKAG